jgi:hypothetical protein
MGTPKQARKTKSPANTLALYIPAVSLTTNSLQSQTLHFSHIIYLHVSYNPQKEIDYFLAQD